MHELDVFTLLIKMAVWTPDILLWGLAFLLAGFAAMKGRYATAGLVTVAAVGSVLRLMAGIAFDISWLVYPNLFMDWGATQFDLFFLGIQAAVGFCYSLIGVSLAVAAFTGSKA